MKALLKKLPLIVISAGITIAIVLAMRPQPVEVDLAKVTRGSLRMTVDEDGVTRIREKYVVAAPLIGRLSRIHLKPGDAIEPGKTLLASIEPTDPALLDVRSRAEIEARVDSANAALERAKSAQVRADFAWEQSKASVKGAQSEVAYTKAEHERIKKLYNQGRSASDQELSTAFFQMRRAEEAFRAAQFAVQVAEQEQKSARFAVRIAEHELKLAKAALVRTEQGSPGMASATRLEIFSPIRGKVLRVHQESATIVQPGKELLEIGDSRDLEIVVDVLSSDAVKIKPGARALLVHWGGEKPLESKVRLIEPSAKTKISALGVEEQRVNVILDLVDPLKDRPNLGDNYGVEARIIIWESEDVLQVPSGSLFRHQNGWAVYVKEGDQAKVRKVTIGHNNGLKAEVLEGIKEKEEVVLYPSDKIKDGVMIAPRKSE